MQARTLAKDVSPQFAKDIEQRVCVISSPGSQYQYVASLKQGSSKEDATKLVAVDAVSGLDMFVARGEWDECIRQAASQVISIVHICSDS